MGKDKEKSKKTPKSWESYGVAFWITMSISSVIMAILGLVTFSFALLRIMYGDIWFMWFVLAAAGAGAFSLAVFCFDLFPTWAGVVRTIRLSNARIAGAMSISQINKYEEREDRRTAEVKDKVQESYSKVGKDVLATQQQVTEIDDKVTKMFQAFEKYREAARSEDAYRNIESSMDSINRKLEEYVKETDRVITNLKSQLNSIENKKDTSAPSEAQSISTEDRSDTVPPAIGGNETQKTKDTPKNKKKPTKRQEKEEERAKEIFGAPKESEPENKTKIVEEYNDGFSEEDDDLSGLPEDYADALSRMPYTEEELDDIIDSYPDDSFQASESADDFTTTNTDDSTGTHEESVSEDTESSSGNPYADL